MTTPKPLFLANDRLVRRTLETWNPDTAKHEPAEGLPATVRLALTPDGPAVHPTLEAALTERAPGDYFGILQGADVTTHLAAYEGKIVYEIVAAGSAGDYLDFVPLRVTRGRPA